MKLTISDVAFGGSGVARQDGKVFFVPFTIAGETIEARVVRTKKKFAEAELISVEVPSGDRVEPRCGYFQQCGGCAYQHIRYARQLEFKAAQVEQTLRRVGRLADVPMRPIVASPLEYGYRNRIRVHVQDGCAGFYAHGSHALVEISECPISSPEVNDELRRLRAAKVEDGDYTLSTRYGAAFFEQTNDAVSHELLEVVRAAVSPGQALLIDAYCGGGFFARHLAESFEKVIGIEENPQAVEHARRGAAAHESYLAGDVAAQLGDILAAHDPARTTVLLDPPAIGIAPRVSDLLLGSRPAEILYVSCNPATLARDLSGFCLTAYRLEAVTPLDMFPQTAEIEVVARLVAN
jgi:tRNA/tmRNA/rRNA uracil-C5-methylase (TrmA/RlmC/RlmD family)